MDAASQPIIEDIETLRAALSDARAQGAAAQAELAIERAGRSADQALIAHLKLQILSTPPVKATLSAECIASSLRS